MAIRSTAGPRRRRLGGLLVAASVTCTLVPGGPAHAHAGGGQLPYAWWSADGHQVVGRWTAPADDAALIGTMVGVLREGASEAYLGGPASDLPTQDEVAALAASEELRTYLLDNLGVRQGGVACAGEVTPADDFLTDGAEFVFTCPRPVEQVELWITILHDDDLAYQTLSGDGTLQDARHTASEPAHTWDFTLATSGPDANRRVPVGLVLALAGAVVTAALTLRLVGSRRRPERS